MSTSLGFASVEDLRPSSGRPTCRTGASPALYLSLAIDKPLLLEGSEAGVGKTELAKSLAQAAGAG